MTQPKPIYELSIATLSVIEEYIRALQGQRDGQGADALHHAWELARRALADGLGVLELAAVHHRAMLAVLMEALPTEKRTQAVKELGAFCASCPAWSNDAGDCTQTTNGARDYCAKSLSTFAKYRRGWRKATLRRSNEIREEEARRIAHGLHNEAAQLLASLHLELQDLARELPGQQEPLQGVRRLLDQIEDELQCLSHAIRPTVLDDLGLRPALELLAECVARRTGISIFVKSNAGAPLPMIIQTTVYRVAQEALNNVIRHARASRVIIQLRRKRCTLTCSVRDNGVGFEVSGVLAQREKLGLGLVGIRERVDALDGTFSILSSPGRGTKLVVRIPLTNATPCAASPGSEL